MTRAVSEQTPALRKRPTDSSPFFSKTAERGCVAANQAQPVHRAGLPAEGELPSAVGRPLPTRANGFIQRRCRRTAHLEIRPMQKAAKMLRKDPPLIPTGTALGGLLLRRSGGNERQGEARPEESVRIPVRGALRTCPVSCTCGLAAMQRRPRVLPKNRRIQADSTSKHCACIVSASMLYRSSKENNATLNG